MSWVQTQDFDLEVLSHSRNVLLFALKSFFIFAPSSGVAVQLGCCGRGGTHRGPILPSPFRLQPIPRRKRERFFYFFFAIPCNFIYYHAIPYNTRQYHVKLYNTILPSPSHLQPIPRKTKREILLLFFFNTMHYHLITCNTI